MLASQFQESRQMTMDASVRKRQHVDASRRNRDRIRRGKRTPVQLIQPQGLILRRGKPCKPTEKRTHQRVKQAIVTLRSGYVPNEIEVQRNAICHACPHATLVWEEECGVRSWCRCCGCGQWRVGQEGSDNESKNRHASHTCPQEPARFGPWDGQRSTKPHSWLKIGRFLFAAWQATKKSSAVSPSNH